MSGPSTSYASMLSEDSSPQILPQTLKNPHSPSCDRVSPMLSSHDPWWTSPLPGLYCPRDVTNSSCRKLSGAEEGIQPVLSEIAIINSVLAYELIHRGEDSYRNHGDISRPAHWSHAVIAYAEVLLRGF